VTEIGSDVILFWRAVLFASAPISVIPAPRSSAKRMRIRPVPARYLVEMKCCIQWWTVKRLLQSTSKWRWSRHCRVSTRVGRHAHCTTPVARRTARLVPLHSTIHHSIRRVAFRLLRGERIVYVIAFTRWHSLVATVSTFGRVLASARECEQHSAYHDGWQRQRLECKNKCHSRIWNFSKF